MKLKTTLRVAFSFALLFFLGTNILKAQVGIGTTNPASGSLLDIESSDKGLLIPRVTGVCSAFRDKIKISKFICHPFYKST